MWTTVFFIMGLSGGIGLLIGIGVGGTLFVYSLPYLCWLGWNSGSNGVPRTHESDKLSGFKALLLNAKNATKLYRSWITKKPHGIVKY